jgi:predicted nucleotidyltransferase
MRRDEVLRILETHLAEIRAMGVRSLSLFGSVAREQASDSSDVDILVDLDGAPYPLRDWRPSASALDPLRA